jgi:hypothetical protein
MKWNLQGLGGCLLALLGLTLQNCDSPEDPFAAKTCD